MSVSRHRSNRLLYGAIPGAVIAAAYNAGMSYQAAAALYRDIRSVGRTVSVIANQAVRAGRAAASYLPPSPPLMYSGGPSRFNPRGTTVPSAPAAGAAAAVQARGGGGGIGYTGSGRSSRRYGRGRVKGKSSKRIVSKKRKTSKALALRGASKHIEHGGIVQRSAANNSVQVGHATLAHNTVLRQMFMAVLKQLFHRLGLDVRTPTDPILLTAGAVIQLGYKLEPEAAPTSINFPIGLPATLTLITDWFVDSTRPWFNAADESDVTFTYISYWPKADINSQVTSSVRMDMTNCTVDVKCVSNMRIQNRTLFSPETPDTTLNVDTMPLIGYVYSGTGNGPEYYNGAGSLSINNYHGDAVSGVINPNETPYVVPTDPISKLLFKGVKRQRKLRLMPGSIVNFKLSATHHKNFSSMFNVIAKFLNPADESKIALGKFQFISVEKEMDAGPSGDFKFAVEVKYACTVIAHFKRNQVQLQEFEKASGIIV